MMWVTLILVTIGLWLMAAPGVFGYGPPMSTVDRVVGPLIVTCALIAYSEATRAVRWGNFVLGAWLVLAPLALSHGLATTMQSVSTGLVVMLLASLPGSRRERLGGGWAVLWKGSDRTGEPPAASDRRAA